MALPFLMPISLASLSRLMPPQATVESLADLYLDGIKADSGTVLVQANPDKSDKLYLQGAQMGNRECQFLIGKSFRLSGNASEALVYLRQAADQGQPAAAYLAGEMLEKGEGGPSDKEAAKHYYAIAAANQLHAYHQHAAEALQRLGKKVGGRFGNFENILYLCTCERDRGRRSPIFFYKIHSPSARNDNSELPGMTIVNCPE